MTATVPTDAAVDAAAMLDLLTDGWGSDPRATYRDALPDAMRYGKY